jgi:radical SAM superfamily enzyme YgiQ (UPF0313 family)
MAIGYLPLPIIGVIHISMKILLISPERKRKREEAFLFKLGFLNLPYIAAVTPRDVEIKIVDEVYEAIDFDERVDLVGVTAQTPVAPRAYQIASEFRRRGVPVVMGGVHASMLPEEAIQYVDSVVIGEGEISWPHVIEDFKRGELKPFYRPAAKVNIKDLPFPRRDLLNGTHYFPLKLLETSRGCPHKCDFCGVSKFFGNRYRNRPMQEIDRELRMLFPNGSAMNPIGKRFLSLISKDLPYFLKRRLLYIIDSNVVPNRRFAKELFTVLKEYDLLWWGHAPVSVGYDEDLLKLFSESGCVALNIGFESLSSKNLMAMKKGFNQPNRYEEAIVRIHEHGIGIMGTFIVGLDDDDETVFDQITDFVIQNKLDWALTFIMSPCPGTDSFLRLDKGGRILTRDWEKYDSLNAVYKPLLISSEELERGMQRVWKKVFSLPSIYRRIIKGPRIHPLFYLIMNWQFYRLTRSW